MKKLFLIPLIIILVSLLIFVGCAKQAPAPTPAPTPVPAPALAPTPTPATAATIKIGLLYPLTGFLAMDGKRMRDAELLAFEAAGYQVAGKKIEVFVGDSAGNPSTALDVARKMVEHDKVCTILGPVNGDEVSAVADYMTKAGKPHFNTVYTPWSVLSMPWSIAGGGSQLQYVTAAGKYAAEGMHYKAATAITYDTADGHNFVAAFKAAFTAGGGQVIQEQYVPRPIPDFASYLSILKNADVLAAWLQGADSITFLSQVHQFGIRKKMPIYPMFFGGMMMSFLLKAMPPEVANACIGEITATPYSPFIDTDINKKFVADYKQKFGYTPDETETGAIDVVNTLLNALKATGGDTTPEKLREAILQTNFMGLQGQIKFDRAIKCRIRDIYICKVDNVNGEYMWVPVYTYKDVPPAGFAPPPAP